MDWRPLYAYWFDEIYDAHAYIEGRLPIWFFASPEADAQIHRDFVPWLTQITEADKAEWKKTPRGFLTLILLFDQVPRNAFRGTPESFQHDAYALELAEEFMALGWDQELEGVEAFWVHLPFQHQETLAGQAASVSGVADSGARARDGHQIFFGIANDMAARHQVAIQRFGRFPHRNAILGRTSSPEELAFLEDPKNHF